MLIGDLVVTIGADLSNLEKGITKAQNAIQGAGDRFRSAGATLTKGVTLPLLAVGGTAVAAATSVEGAYANIIKGTGATGEALADLQDSFRNVARTVPNSLGDVGQAIADVNTRTGLMGTALETTTRRVLDFARVNSVEAAGATRTLSQLMNALELDVETLPAVMDKLTFAAQRSGIGALDLAAGITEAGMAFVEMGFDLDKSIALFSQFEAVGARPADVISSLNIALTRLAREGHTDAQAAFSELLTRIGEAPSVMEATAIAADAFGARVGAKLAEEIRGGTFEIGDFVDALQGVDGVLERTAAQTLTLGERMAQMKNSVTLTLAPLGEELVAALSDLQPLLMDAAEWLGKIVKWFTNLEPNTQKVIFAILGLGAVLGPVVTLLGLAAGAVAMITWPALAVAAAIGLLTAAGVALYLNWEEIKAYALKMRDAINKWGEGVMQSAKDVGGVVVDFAKSVIAWLGKLLDPFDKVLKGVEAVTGAFGRMYNKVVGNSYVPDMVEGVRAEFARLDELMVRPAQLAAAQVNAAFASITGPLAPALVVAGGAGGERVEAATARLTLFAGAVDEAAGQLTDLGIGELNNALREAPALVQDFGKALANAARGAVGMGISSGKFMSTLGAGLMTGGTSALVSAGIGVITKGIGSLFGRKKKTDLVPTVTSAASKISKLGAAATRAAGALNAPTGYRYEPLRIHEAQAARVERKAAPQITNHNTYQFDIGIEGSDKTPTELYEEWMAEARRRSAATFGTTDQWSNL
jgi:TP901 family phage tail tape measure protein